MQPTFIDTLLVFLFILLVAQYLLNRKHIRQAQSMKYELSKNNETIISIGNENIRLLKEKEWLLKEIHHRVRNNLQLVMSLLNRQSADLKNGAAIKAIQKSQQRMYAISLVHLKLYQSKNFTRLDMQDYIYELVESLKNNFTKGPNIQFSIESERIQLDITQCLPIGLILNEALTNAIEHAFTGHSNGKISVRLVSLGIGNKYLLTIVDNGSGLPAHVDFSHPHSSGMWLIKGLSKQLGAVLTIENTPGVKIAVVFSDFQPATNSSYDPEGS